MSEANYQLGDLVEAVKGELVHRERLVKAMPGHGSQRLRFPTLGSGWYIDQMEDEGFTLTTIEGAKPPVVLPTEPGAVIRFRGSFGVWQLFSSGLWQNAVSGRDDPREGKALVEIYGSDFEVLEVIS